MRLPVTLFCALSLGLGACESPFVVEIEGAEPRLVIQSLFAADSLITLGVGQSVSALAPGGVPVDDVATATVRLYEDGVFVGEAAYVSNGDYFASEVRARAGRTYRVEVSAPGFPDASAEDAVPLPVPFTAEVVRGPDPAAPGRRRLDDVTVRFSDPAGADAYALYGLVEQSAEGGSFSQVFPLAFLSGDAILADGNLATLLGNFETPVYRRAVFGDRLFAGEAVVLRITVPRFEPAAGVRTTDRLRLARLSETYYRYLRALEGDGVDSPFDTPQALPSNVDGGYGVFAAFAASERVLPD